MPDLRLPARQAIVLLEIELPEPDVVEHSQLPTIEDANVMARTMKHQCGDMAAYCNELPVPSPRPCAGDWEDQRSRVVNEAERISTTRVRRLMGEALGVAGMHPHPYSMTVPVSRQAGEKRRQAAS